MAAVASYYANPTPAAHSHQFTKSRGHRECDACGNIEHPGQRFRMCGGCLITQVRPHRLTCSPSPRFLTSAFSLLRAYFSTARPTARNGTGPRTRLSATTPQTLCRLLSTRHPSMMASRSQSTSAASARRTRLCCRGLPCRPSSSSASPPTSAKRHSTSSSSSATTPTPLAGTPPSLLTHLFNNQPNFCFSFHVQIRRDAHLLCLAVLR